MDESEHLYSPVNFNPVDFSDNLNYYRLTDSNFTQTYSPIPIDIFSSTPPYYNNKKITKNFNKNKEDSLKSIITNTPQHARSNENIHIEHIRGDNNNNKSKHWFKFFKQIKHFN